MSASDSIVYAFLIKWDHFTEGAKLYFGAAPAPVRRRLLSGTATNPLPPLRACGVGCSEIGAAFVRKPAP